jgi:triacylglycerol lipase
MKLTDRQLLDACFGKTVPGYGRITINEAAKDTTAWVYQTGLNSAVLAFEGSEERRDWIRNLHTGKRPWVGGRVHAGWHEAWMSIWYPVVMALKNHGTPSVITGYSLGGAIAQIAAAGIGASRVVTFAAPRAGNTAFARELSLRCEVTRYVYGSDPVRRLPPWWLGYRHAGELRRLGPRPWMSNPRHHAPGGYRDEVGE